MQTFLPSSDFLECARVLDSKRLHSQLNEGLIMLRGIVKGYHGWSHHPARKMWEYYPRALVVYLYAMLEEYESRGYDRWPYDPIWRLDVATDGLPLVYPPWLGDERLHASHRSNLLRKDPEHYGQFGWKEEPDLPYFWPTKEGYEVTA